MDQRVELYKEAFSHSGRGLDIPVFRGSHRYQYGQGFGDVLRGIWRFFKPIAAKGVQTLLKAGSEAITEGATVKDVIKSTIKPTLGAVLGATADQISKRMEEENNAPPPQTGTGKRRRTAVYKSHKGSKRKYNSVRSNF